MSNRLDIIVFGATGFTGKYTLPQVHKLGKVDGRTLTWGIAGRSEQKLKDVLVETAKRIGVDSLSSIPIIVADVADEESIKKMTARAKVIINCCGPYNLYGEVVVKSCVETGTHHLDVSGESVFIERMELKYRKAAEEKGVYIVSACGMESIPADLGLVFVENNFEGTLNSLESYLYAYEEGGNTPGSKVHFGTYHSAVNGLASFREMFVQRKKLYPNPLPKFQPQLSWRFPIRKIHNKWALPFPVTDEDVINRSQRYFYEQEKKRPVQVHTYAFLDSFIVALACMFMGTIFLILSQFSYGRKLLLQYPKFFSGGFMSHDDPTEETLEKQRVVFTLYCEGWSEKLTEGEDKYKTPPNKAIVGRVMTANPGYGFTCVALTLCAVVILTEPKKLPAKGGIYTTAAAFSKTSLIEQMQKNGADFEIISVKDL